MFHLAIRCHPSVPVAADELEHWLEQQVTDLRVVAPQGTVRLSRLTQHLPSGDISFGWLLELELSDAERRLVDDRLTEALRDMELLGFQPTVFVALEGADSTRSPHATRASTLIATPPLSACETGQDASARFP